MADRLVSVDDKYDFPAAVAKRQAEKVAEQIDAPIAEIASRPAVSVGIAGNATSDSIVPVRVGPAVNAVMLRPVDYTRKITIAQNLGPGSMMVAESPVDTISPPDSGYVAVPAGSEYVSASARSVWAYMSTTAATARVYTAQGV